jgi:uncharacterized protein (DUF302 family)
VADVAPDQAGIVTKLSPKSVADAVEGFTGILKGKGLTVFAVIDQSAAAHDVGLDLRDTTLVIFGSPLAGTPVMVSSPLSALDLPLKVLIWSDEGQTKVSYLAPSAFASRYHLDADLAHNLAGIDALTDALTAQ